MKKQILFIIFCLFSIMLFIPTTTPNNNVILTNTKDRELEIILTYQTIKEPVSEIVPQPVLPSNHVQKRICEVFGAECNNALIIAKYESGYRSDAISPTGDYGVMQINCYWQGYRIGLPKRTTNGRCNELLDLELNLQIAKQIYNEQGWNAWYTKKYLTN